MIELTSEKRIWRAGTDVAVITITKKELEELGMKLGDKIKVWVAKPEAYILPIRQIKEEKQEEMEEPPIPRTEEPTYEQRRRFTIFGRRE